LFFSVGQVVILLSSATSECDLKLPLHG